jgi:hypothetical protein
MSYGFMVFLWERSKGLPYGLNRILIVLYLREGMMFDAMSFMARVTYFLI